MRSVALFCLAILLAGCAPLQGVSLEFEKVARRKLPLVNLWEVQVRVANRTEEALKVDPRDFQLTDSAGESHTPGVSEAMAGVGLVPVAVVPVGKSAVSTLHFVLPAGRTPATLRFGPGPAELDFAGMVDES